jgi:hypothetical protein
MVKGCRWFILVRERGGGGMVDNMVISLDIALHQRSNNKIYQRQNRAAAATAAAAAAQRPTAA